MHVHIEYFYTCCICTQSSAAKYIITVHVKSGIDKGLKIPSLSGSGVSSHMYYFYVSFEKSRSSLKKSYTE